MCCGIATLACSDLIGPNDQHSRVPDLPQAGTYTLIPVDSPGLALGAFTASGYSVGLADDNQVFGRYSAGGALVGLFRWKQGIFSLFLAPDFSQKAFNARGDVVGNIGSTHRQPVIWYAEDAAPTRIFPFDTLVDAIDVNNRREVLLAPVAEFGPGASLWRDGVSSPVGSGIPLSGSALTDSGLVWVTARGRLLDSSWFATSTFHPGASFTPACASHPTRQVLSIARRGHLILSQLQYADTSRYFVDDGETCRNLSASVPGFLPGRVLDNGLIVGSNPAAVGVDALGPVLSNGRSSVRMALLLRDPSTGWSVQNAYAMNASGTFLVLIQKAGGYGQGKLTLGLLVP